VTVEKPISTSARGPRGTHPGCLLREQRIESIIGKEPGFLRKEEKLHPGAVYDFAELSLDEMHRAIAELEFRSRTTVLPIAGAMISSMTGVLVSVSVAVPTECHHSFTRWSWFILSIALLAASLMVIRGARDIAVARAKKSALEAVMADPGKYKRRVSLP